jgi:5-methylcytosine-specific restriction protein A
LPKRLCLESKCPLPTHYRGRCQRHQKERNRETRSQNAKVYNTKRWKLLRRHKLQLNPICERCDMTLANEVHHVIAIQAGGDPWNLSNLEALCRVCHSKETRREQLT